MAKLRVHELAKELGITSKKLLEVLKDSGEFVKSASSTIEAPVVRKAREYMDAHPELSNNKKRPAAQAAAKPAAAKPAATPAVCQACGSHAEGRCASARSTGTEGGSRRAGTRIDVGCSSVL